MEPKRGYPPKILRECACGDGRVLEVCDGLGVVYSCMGCSEFLGELILGPGP